jgi:RNA polymerase sigma factor (sigma-70 family)
MDNFKKYVSIVKSWGEFNMAEDIVQEMYLKILSMPKEKQISQAYIWFVLRSIFIDYHREKKKFKRVDIDNSILEQIDQEEEIETYNILINKINQESKRLPKKEMYAFNLNVSKKISIHKIAKGAGVNSVYVWRAVKSAKEKIKKECEQEYKSYINSKL